MKQRTPPLLPPGTNVGWTPYAWLVYLPTFYITPVVLTRAGVAPWWLWPLTIAATLLFLVTYFAGFWVKGSRLAAIAAVQTVLGIAFAPINPGSCVFFVYAASFVANLDRSRDALRGVLLIAALGGLTLLLTEAPPFFGMVAVLITLVVGGVNLHYSQQGRAASKLRLAHEEIEQLAAIAERERIARDLHDLLGHTLSLIVLKSELAVKLSDIDPARAAREMRDVEDVARTTLQDVRLAIRGYRTTLVEELDRSRSLLKAARITADFDVAEIRLPQAVEETFALALREAVTNVVRHADAVRCTIRLTHRTGAVVLEIADDGRGLAGAPGLGLRGMRERVEAMGGRMSIDDTKGTRVTLSVPAAAPTTLTRGDAEAAESATPSVASR